jgi:hypothetical protein
MQDIVFNAAGVEVFIILGAMPFSSSAREPLAQMHLKLSPAAGPLRLFAAGTDLCSSRNITFWTPTMTFIAGDRKVINASAARLLAPAINASFVRGFTDAFLFGARKLENACVASR